MSVEVPDIRVRPMNTAPIRIERDYVLYWMIAFRRTRWNFSLDRAANWAARLQRPLLVFEPLSCSYPWASDRFHQFILEGMDDNSRMLANTSTDYFPYLEPKSGAGKGLLKALASEACVVITDDYPAFFLPKIIHAAAAQLDVRLEAVDSNGLLPLAAASRAYPTAASFRRHLQRTLRQQLKIFPSENALAGVRIPRFATVPISIRRRWPAAKGPLSTLPIDHAIAPAGSRGGMIAARERLAEFLADGIGDYSLQRNRPDADATSNLSTYLHFGHISAHEVFTAVTRREGWSPEKLRRKPDGKRSGWWNMSESAEQFLDQIITWRELGFNFAAHRTDYDQYASLPAWAQATLERHSTDRRKPRYNLRAVRKCAYTRSGVECSAAPACSRGTHP